MMGLTEEQVKAYDELKVAVENCLKAHGHDESMMVSDFIVLTATQKVGDDGTIVTIYPSLYKDGDMPWYMVHGLIHKHTLEFNRMSLEHEDNG